VTDEKSASKYINQEKGGKSNMISSIKFLNDFYPGEFILSEIRNNSTKIWLSVEGRHAEDF
jgi:hypothetical protein